MPPQTQGTVLIGLSSNGWFGDTVQPYQHVNASILRAVENRLPFVHVLNNGPSVVVLPNGRVVFQSQFRGRRLFCGCALSGAQLITYGKLA